MNHANEVYACYTRFHGCYTRFHGIHGQGSFGPGFWHIVVQLILQCRV